MPTGFSHQHATLIIIIIENSDWETIKQRAGPASGFIVKLALNQTRMVQ